MTRTVHIIGAGLAGLAAAVKLAPSAAKVVVHEATGYPGGRCRSYLDRTIGMTIDNGNHLVLSGNHAVLDFVQAIGSAAPLTGPAAAGFPFVDLSSGERWTLRINDGLPWWIFDKNRRVPGTRLGEYLRLSRLLWAKGDAPVADVIDCSGPLYERLVHPLLLAALNIEPRQGSAALAERSGARDAGARRPGVPAADRARGARRRPSSSRRSSICASATSSCGSTTSSTPSALPTTGSPSSTSAPTPSRLGADDAVILAVPSHAAAALVPELTVPQGHRAIANAHFRIAVPHGHAADARRHQRHHRMDFRVCRPAFGHDQQCRSPDGRAARNAGPVDLAGGVPRDGNCRRAAAVADRPRAAGDLRGHAGGECQAPRRADAVAQSRSGRRLDRDRVAGDLGKRGAVRQSCGGGRHDPKVPGQGHDGWTGAISTAASRRRRGRCSIASARTASGASSSRPTATIPGRIRSAAPLSRRAGRCRAGAQDRRLSAADAKRAARRLGAVPGRRLRHEREREGLFRPQDDRRCRSMRRTWRGRGRRSAHAAARRAPTFSPRYAGAVRLHPVARGAGDAGRDHAVPEMVSVPSRQDFVLEPHRHRPAAGADESQAGGAQSQERPDRRAVPRSAGDARAGAEGAAAERGAVLVLPRRRRPAAAGRAGVFQDGSGSARSRPRWRGPSSGSTARMGLARSIRRWRTA